MSDNLFSVANKIVIVTGGLGQLGWQFSNALLERDAKVAIFDVQSHNPGMQTKPSRDKVNDRLLLLKVDVTQRSSVEAGLDHVNEIWGIPHALVNNAALDSPPESSTEANGPFESYPVSCLDHVMDVNVKGTFLSCQAIGKQLAQAGRGSIINISSIYGAVSPDQRIYEYSQTHGPQFFKPAAYSASKSALYNLTRYLATYWASKNVRVNTLTLGGVFNNQHEQFIKNYAERVPLGRMAQENEYNGALLFLVSDASSYMTGSNLTIDGGWTAW